jgi:hypothetical protein
MFIFDLQVLLNNGNLSPFEIVKNLFNDSSSCIFTFGLDPPIMPGTRPPPPPPGAGCAGTPALTAGGNRLESRPFG